MRNDFYINVPVVNNSNNPTPQEPATLGSAGIDLRYSGEDRILQPLERGLFDTGLHMSIPSGHVGLVCPRSGLAVKHGISVVNAPGILDADYGGSIGVILINLSNEPFEIHNGDRIAQLVITQYNMPFFNEVTELEKTERGEGGFGHTGVQ